VRTDDCSSEQPFMLTDSLFGDLRDSCTSDIMLTAV
jgi:hypothetical protein